MTLLSALDTQSQFLLGPLESSFNAFLSYSFEGNSSSLLIVTQDDEEQLSLRVVDWTALSHFERLQYRLMGSASLEKIAYFVSVHFQRYLVPATQQSSFERQCALLQKKVKSHNRGLFSKSIEFKSPFVKQQFTVIVTYPVIPERLRQELQFTTETLTLNYSPLSTFAKLNKRLQKWKHYTATSETVTSLPRIGTRIADWVAAHRIDQLEIVFSDVNLKGYIAGEVDAERDRVFQQGYHQGIESRRALF